MNFLKRAWLSLIAKKGRSVLLILVTSAIMLFVLAGMLIHNAADTATTNAKQSVGASLTLSANREAAFKSMQKGTSSSSKPKLTTTPVKLSNAKKIAQLNNVSSYNATASTSVNAKSFDAISTSSSSGPGEQTSSSSGDIAVTGVTNTSQVSSFEDETNKITKGRGLTSADKNSNNTVIESDLAKQNNVSVGDTIKVKSTTGTKKTYKLKVVGIYKASSSASTQQGPGATDPANTIYTSYTFANTIKGSKYANTADSVTFTIANPSQVSSVKQAGNKVINNSKFTLATNDSSYQTVKAAMNNVKSFADKIVWLVAIAGTIILALIVILMIRERRHEIGVLLSLGEARWKIIGQFFAEMVIVLIVAIGIAGIGGKFVGDKLGDQLVSQQTSSSAATISAPGDKSVQMSGKPGGTGGTGGGSAVQSGGPGGTGTSGSTQQTDLDVNVTMLNMVELGGFGLVIMFLSTMIASGGILRLQPKKVLIE
ncbi:ABC transporter permease [Paucilactobacillus hokkaidonensis JCM 18461]|uniref:ABC transporter permease n=2 Tax=Paucilactobacillus hokkaidonensis TaxID=1193095 RepID=A0A0A1GSC8_9LACO|nr:ABC transporter permease [Paucilactobacillus hokkaidonensis]KRO08143.1 ABC superfamily ATP binding cassette transporter, membrane protein [Paucilactobacillus hokkaidonensis]BAP84905.1 ABC transporter permease [Paucilactobacillus hokkaidonensis JCM 18461]